MVTRSTGCEFPPEQEAGRKQRLPHCQWQRTEERLTDCHGGKNVSRETGGWLSISRFHRYGPFDPWYSKVPLLSILPNSHSRLLYSRGSVRVEPSFKWCKNPSQIMWEDRYWLRGNEVTGGPRCKTEGSGQSRGRFPIPEMKIRNPLTDGRTDCHVGKRRRSEKRKDGRRKGLCCTQRRREKNGWKRRAQT